MASSSDKRATVSARGGALRLFATRNPRLETALPKVWAMVCVDPPGFDRAAFHRAFNGETMDFFRKQPSSHRAASNGDAGFGEQAIVGQRRDRREVAVVLVVRAFERGLLV